MQLTKYQPPAPPPSVDSLMLAYWLMYCRAPGRKTAPGEPVDLGEIGADVEKIGRGSRPTVPVRKNDDYQPRLQILQSLP